MRSRWRGGRRVSTRRRGRRGLPQSRRSYACSSPSVSRAQLQLACLRERRRLQPRDEEGGEALQQQLIVVLVHRADLREELQRVGAGERVGKRAHDEMQAPGELLAREVRQRLEERFLVAADHLGGLRRKE